MESQGPESTFSSNLDVSIGDRYTCLDSGASRCMTGTYTCDLMENVNVTSKPVIVKFPNGVKTTIMMHPKKGFQFFF